MMSTIKIAVIGAGWWGTTAHIPALKENPRADIVIIDKNPDALRAAARKYDVSETYTSLDDALNAHNDIQGAIVAVPHQAHYEAAKEVLEADLHLLLEKPMVLTAKHAKELVDLAAEKKREILMGYTFPYIDSMQSAKKRLDEGLIGDIEYVTCSMTSMTIEYYRGNPKAYERHFNFPVTGPTEKTYADPAVAGGGQGHLQITHSAAMMFHFAPALRAEIVSAFMNRLDTQVDVCDAIAVRMTSGAVATVGSTGNIGKGDSGIVEVHLHGSRGRLLADAITGNVFIRLHDGHEERLVSANPAYPTFVPANCFVEMILDGAENRFPASHDGLYTVELLEAAYRSAAQEGMPVRVASLYE
ncbi:MAG TPA: Gfo/Idh/MocA family oxidoreductase [Aggregatilineales bacterium]|nr:Gfo/Idh/MocA family oxidoreductase [Aggregatilineales bacterium]